MAGAAGVGTLRQRARGHVLYPRGTPLRGLVVKYHLTKLLTESDAVNVADGFPELVLHLLGLDLPWRLDRCSHVVLGGRLRRLGLFGLADAQLLGARVEVLLPLRLAFEHGGDLRLLVALQRRQSLGELEQVDRAVHRARA
eukprot:scaffold61550_cov67-Phaeocystis_antarctica.AAC.6